MPVTEKEARAAILSAVLRGDVGRPEPPVRRPLTPEEIASLEALAAGENAQARRRVQEGIAEDRDFSVSPFAPNRFGTGPVGPSGLGFGVIPPVVGDQAFELPTPNTPDRAMITPELLQLFLAQALKGI